MTMGQQVAEEGKETIDCNLGYSVKTYYLKKTPVIWLDTGHCIIWCHVGFSLQSSVRVNV